MVAASAAIVVLVGAGAWAFVGGSLGCQRLTLSVDTTPDFAPTLRQLANRFAQTNPRVGGACIQVKVTAREAAQEAVSLAGTRTVIGAVTGGGSTATSAPAGSGTGQQGRSAPDVWIPDSSVWAEVAQAGQQPVAPAGSPSAAGTPGAGGAQSVAGIPSVASSPVVIAMPRPLANQVSASGVLAWSRLLQELTRDRTFQIGVPDPTRDTAGLAALLAFGNLTGGSAQGHAEQIAAMRTLSGSTAPSTTRLFEKLPKTQDSTAIANSLGALPATEQAVWRYDTASPAVPLAALYPTEGALRLDYPYVVTATDAKHRQAANRFLLHLGKAASRKVLADAGFRAPDGGLNPTLTRVLPGAAASPKIMARPPTATVSATIRAWRNVSLPGRTLLVIDASGSMVAPVPGDGRSRLDVTLSAAQQSFGLSDNSSEIGLWIFSDQLNGSTPYRQLVPIGPLGQAVNGTDRRGALADALTSIRPKPNGRSGLYQTVLDAYRTVKAGYDPNKVDSVLVFTDGGSDDPTSPLNLDQLISQLGKDADPAKPLPVFLVGIGPTADLPAEQRIAQVTGGTAYRAATAQQVSAALLDAVGQR